MGEKGRKYVVSQITSALGTDKSYIAVHSLGASREDALKIIGDIGTLKQDKYIIKRIDEIQLGQHNAWEFSQIWFKNEDGKNMFLMIAA